MKSKWGLTKKFTPFLNKMKTMKKNVKIIFFDNAGKKRLSNKLIKTIRRD